MINDSFRNVSSNIPLLEYVYTSDTSVMHVPDEYGIITPDDVERSLSTINVNKCTPNWLIKTLRRLVVVPSVQSLTCPLHYNKRRLRTQQWKCAEICWQWLKNYFSYCHGHVKQSLWKLCLWVVMPYHYAIYWSCAIWVYKELIHYSLFNPLVASLMNLCYRPP